MLQLYLSFTAISLNKCGTVSIPCTYVYVSLLCYHLACIVKTYRAYSSTCALDEFTLFIRGVNLAWILLYERLIVSVNRSRVTAHAANTETHIRTMNDE